MYNYNATVVNVVDGDTMDCLIDLGFGIKVKQRVRLYGINIYETSLRDGQTPAEKALGLECKDMLVTLFIQKNPNITITTHQGQGKYGRWLGVITLNDGQDLAEMLREAGYERIKG